MPKEEGKQKSIAIARQKLKEIDVVVRCRLHNFPPFYEGKTNLNIFGIEAEFYLDGYQLVKKGTSTELKSDDKILFLHYLLSDIPVADSEKYISFRELPGGQFYWQPFQSRSVAPLLKRIGNNLYLLRNNLDRFNWQPLNSGDFSAKVHVLGNIYLLLVYHLGDDEFPPALDLLFSEGVKRIYNAEDAAAIASRVCIGLL